MNKLTNIKERILYVVKTKGISYETFFPQIGMTYASFKGNAKKTPLNSDAIENLLTIFPDVNPTWLLTGEGDMLLTKELTELNKYVGIAGGTMEPADQMSKVITWMVLSTAYDSNRKDFSFNSFGELAEIFSLAATIAKGLQETIEVDIYSETLNSIKNNPVKNDDGSFIVPDSVADVANKYQKIYTKFKDISIDLQILFKSEDIIGIINKVTSKNMK